MGQRRRIGQREVGALAELRTHRVRGVADADNAAAAGPVEHHIPVGGEEELIEAGDLVEQVIDGAGEGADRLLPGIEAGGADGRVGIGGKTPEEADGWRCAGGGSAGGECAEHVGGAAVDLSQDRSVSAFMIGRDEPERAPWVWGGPRGQAEVLAQGGACAIGDDDQIERAFAAVLIVDEARGGVEIAIETDHAAVGADARGGCGDE